MTPERVVWQARQDAWERERIVEVLSRVVADLTPEQGKELVALAIKCRMRVAPSSEEN